VCFSITEESDLKKTARNVYWQDKYMCHLNEDSVVVFACFATFFLRRSKSFQKDKVEGIRVKTWRRVKTGVNTASACQ